MDLARDSGQKGQEGEVLGAAVELASAEPEAEVVDSTLENLLIRLLQVSSTPGPHK